MTNRVHIDAPAGVIDIEGEKDFVEGLLAKLFPLIEEAGFGSRPTTMVEDEEAGADDGPSIAGVTNSDTSPNGAKKRTRKSVKKPPAGQSCPARIQILKDEGFFKEHRNQAEIVAKLKSKGWTHNLNQVGSATSKLFTRGVLQRTKEGNGPWLYFSDWAET